MEWARPSDATIIQVQRQEMDRLNDNRMLMIAALEEVRRDAELEIGRLNGVISVALGLLDEDGRARVHRAMRGEEDPASVPSANGADPGSA